MPICRRIWYGNCISIATHTFRYARAFRCVIRRFAPKRHTGKPYDTLDEVIKGADGSLYDFGIKYDQIDMIGDCIDLEKVKEKAANPFVKVVFLQRSRGYSLRNAISIAQIEEAVKVVRSVN
ncbi:MAG: methionine gamma-lyase family protein, partial [Clostridia bacterium]|nr:methionine gamma-lyase family protein [Clostridia bacterium]